MPQNQVEIEFVVTDRSPGQMAQIRGRVKSDAEAAGADIEQAFRSSVDRAGAALDDLGPRAQRAFGDVRPPPALEARIVGDMREAGRKGGDAFAEGITEGAGDAGQGVADGLVGALTGPVGGAALAFGLAFGDDFMAGVTQGLNSGRGGALRAIRTGLDPATLGDLGQEAGDLYARGFGDGLGSMRDAAATVEQNLRAVDAALDTGEITRYAATFEEAFGIAIPESTRRARRLIRNELAGDTVEAFDLMGAAAVDFGDTMDDGLGVLDEFAPTFRAIGIDGASAVALIGTSIEEELFTNIDRAGDMWLELRNRVVASDDAREAIERLGLDFDRLRLRIAEGGDTGERALRDLLGALLDIESDAALAAAAVEIFGVNLEEVSDPRHAFQLFEQALALEQVEGSAADAADALEESVTAWDEFSRNVEARGAELGETFAELADDASYLVDFLGDAFGFGDPGQAFDDATTSVEGLRDAIGFLVDEFGGNWESAATRGITAADLASDALLAMREPADGATAAMLDAADAANDAAEAFDAFSNRFAVDSTMRQLDADADRLAATFADLEAGTYDLATGFDTSTEAGRRAEAASERLSGSLDDLLDLYERGDITAGQFVSAQERIMDAFRRAASDAGLSEDAIEQLIRDYATLVGLDDVTKTINADGNAWAQIDAASLGLTQLDGRTANTRILTTSNTAEAVANATSLLNSVAGRVVSNVIQTTFRTVGSPPRAGGGGTVTRREAGGPVGGHESGGRIPTIVNEAGIEAARSPRGDVALLEPGSSVLPHANTMALGGRGGPQVIVQVTVEGSVIADADFERRIQAAVADGLRSGGLDGLGGVQ